MSATQRGVVRRPAPTGHVRKSFGHLDAAVAAATFRGLPEGVHHPKQLLEPLRRLGARLPFPREALATLDLLFDYTNPEDWREGGRPMVFPGNAEIAGCLGVSERTVRNHLSALERAGIISIERGPGNRRTPVRNGLGEIVEAYGINLAPLAEKAEAMKETAEAQARRRARLKAQMRAATSALQDVRTAQDAVEVVLAETPGDESLVTAAAALAALRAEAETKALLARRAFERDPVLSEAEQARNEAEITGLAECLMDLAGDANQMSYQALLPKELETKEYSGRPEVGFRHDSTSDPIQKCKSFQRSVGAGTDSAMTSRPRLPGLENQPDFTRSSADPQPMSVKPTHLLDRCPEFGDVLREHLLIDHPETADVPAFADAARLIALRLGVSDWCWRTGCAQHGRMNAVLCVAVTLLKPRHEIRKSRQAFLAGMLLRPRGELNALASWHALRKRQNE